MNTKANKQKSFPCILCIRGLPLILINKEQLCVTIQTKITTVDSTVNARTETLVSVTATEKTIIITIETTATKTTEEHTEEEIATLVVSAIFSVVVITNIRLTP